MRVAIYCDFVGLVSHIAPPVLLDACLNRMDAALRRIRATIWPTRLGLPLHVPTRVSQRAISFWIVQFDQIFGEALKPGLIKFAEGAVDRRFGRIKMGHYLRKARVYAALAAERRLGSDTPLDSTRNPPDDNGSQLAGRVLQRDEHQSRTVAIVSGLHTFGEVLMRCHSRHGDHSNDFRLCLSANPPDGGRAGHAHSVLPAGSVSRTTAESACPETAPSVLARLDVVTVENQGQRRVIQKLNISNSSCLKSGNRHPEFTYAGGPPSGRLAHWPCWSGVADAIP